MAYAVGVSGVRGQLLVGDDLQIGIDVETGQSENEPLADAVHVPLRDDDQVDVAIAVNEAYRRRTDAVYPARPDLALDESDGLLQDPGVRDVTIGYEPACELHTVETFR